MASDCNHCPLKAKYDKNPASFIARFWRWHIRFCPGWKGYFTALPPEEQNELRKKYHFDKQYKE